MIKKNLAKAKRLHLIKILIKASFSNTYSNFKQMKRQVLILISGLMTSFLAGQALPQKISEKEFSIGKTIHVHSKILNEERVLNIYLPLAYASDSSKTYPVIYLLDGSKDEDFIHVSGIVQFGSFPWINMIPESIVVGIGNVDRKRDFTYPSQNKLDQKEFPTSGKSEAFILFLAKELQPFIDASYRTSTVKTIIGQSLGGLLASEILFEKPELFDNYIIVSPSLWWDDEKLLDRQPKPYNTNKSIYIAGGKEGEVMERTAKELYHKLEQNKDERTKLYYDFLENKTHGDALHIAVYKAFEKIFD
ncbi:MAG: alpha/beta hydrolase-fold protein [Bacteroidota bacterium]